MRRKNRYIVNTALAIGGLTALVDVMLQWKEHREKNTEFSWNSFDGFRTLIRSLKGASVGAVLGYGLYQYRINEEAKLPFDPDNYLRKQLSSEHLKKDLDTFKKVIKYREKLKEWMISTFGNRLVSSPEDTGSFIKRTAISSNYDLDIVLPFKRNGYSTLEEMYNDVHRKLVHAFGNEAIVEKQTKGIGITLDIDSGPIHIDVVPGREIGNYSIDKSLNLYIKPNWFWQRGGSFKTNVGIQKRMTMNNPGARTSVKLLKIYRERNRFNLPTLIIEQCVVEAMSDTIYGEYSSITENLLNCMTYLARKLNSTSLIDSSNSNNNLLDKISIYDRQLISQQLIEDVIKIEENPRYVKEIFDC